VKTDIKKEGDRLTVSVSIPKRVRARDPSILVNTKKIVEFLLENGYNDINSYKIVKHGLCSTISHEQVLNSEWVFEKNKPERSTSGKATKSSKPAPKPRAGRGSARKTTTTKSEEDKLLGTKDMGGVQSQTQTGLPGSNKKVPRK
jgi:hypothetical protein